MILGALYESCVRTAAAQWAFRTFDRGTLERTRSMSRLRAGLPWRGKPRVWFHGASVGELASFWPVLREMRTEIDAVVTGFSDSALGVLRAHQHDEGMAFVGLSPMEGQWGRALDWVQPELFISMRYEAWPELWASLRSRNIPLLQLQSRDAMDRPSLKWAQALVPSRGNWRPEFAGDEMGDPRWDEIDWQAKHPPHEMQDWLNGPSATEFPRPWGVLGSGWANEWAELGPHVLRVLRGTLFCFPHDLASSGDLRWNLDVEALRSDARVEMRWVHGWLTAFYTHADWAWVGGGHGDQSVHSILEPVAAGIPVVCGPRGLDRFKDYSPFFRTGQVSVALTGDALARWLVEFQRNFDDNQRRPRFDQSELQGASLRVASWIRDRVHARGRS